MTLARMADRSLPLAERVQAAMFLAVKAAVGMSEGMWTKDQNDEADRATTELLADIAAADRLARAAGAWYAAVDESPLPDHGMSVATAAEYEMDQAEEAYRARMGKGVGDAPVA